MMSLLIPSSQTKRRLSNVAAIPSPQRLPGFPVWTCKKTEVSTTSIVTKTAAVPRCIP